MEHTTVSVSSARAFMARYDVISKPRNAPLQLGSDGRIDDVEMNRPEVAQALHALPNAEFAKVWSAMSDRAQRLYFFQMYPALKNFRGYDKPYDDPMTLPYFSRKGIRNDDGRAMLATITSPRDLAYFARMGDWVVSTSSSETFGIHLFGALRDRRASETLRVQAEALMTRRPIHDTEARKS